MVKSNTKRTMRSLNFNDGLPVITIHKNGYECGHNLVSKTLGCVADGNSSGDKRQIKPWKAGITFYLSDITGKNSAERGEPHFDLRLLYIGLSTVHNLDSIRK